MAEHDHTPSPSTPVTVRGADGVIDARGPGIDHCGTGRRAVLALAGAFSAIGITAGAAASAADLAPNPDAGLLALRSRLEAAVREVSATEMTDPGPGISAASRAHEAWISRVGEELQQVCWEIVDMPLASTAQGLAFQAAAAMHQLRFAYPWAGSGEEMAWQILSRIAGEAYVPPQLPDHLADAEPERI